MLSVIILNVIMLGAVMLNVAMLSVVMLSVIRLNVVNFVAPYYLDNRPPVPNVIKLFVSVIHEFS